MTEDDAFIRTILADPTDPTPRLIYADWLEERGDPRGEYLRPPPAPASAPAEGGEARALRRQLLELGPRIPVSWLAVFDRPAAWEQLRRLGAGVRAPDVFAEAYAVARETMGRVRHNVALLARRLSEA